MGGPTWGKAEFFLLFASWPLLLPSFTVLQSDVI